MRIFSWNVGHMTNPTVVTDEMIEAISALKPDVVILNEFVEHPSLFGHMHLQNKMREIGLEFSDVSTRYRKSNQVFLASRDPFNLSTSVSPPDAEWAANLLNVYFPTSGIELVAMRVPSGESARAGYWKWFEDTLGGLYREKLICIGDLNVDPERDIKWAAGKALKRLEMDGRWIVASGRGWSFKSKKIRTQVPSRLDHAIISKELPIVGADYVHKVPNCERWFAAEDGTGMSDHAALLLVL